MRKNDIKEGLGQCIAQMVGAQLFNVKEGNEIDQIYGCVTTGEDWQFLQLADTTILMDSTRYYLSDLSTVLWILQHIIDTYRSQQETILPEKN